jgi:hypothetical protein
MIRPSRVALQTLCLASMFSTSTRDTTLSSMACGSNPPADVVLVTRQNRSCSQCEAERRQSLEDSAPQVGMQDAGSAVHRLRPNGQKCIYCSCISAEEPLHRISSPPRCRGSAKNLEKKRREPVTVPSIFPRTASSTISETRLLKRPSRSRASRPHLLPVADLKQMPLPVQISPTAYRATDAADQPISSPDNSTTKKKNLG